jgi:hypothetical protein
MHFKPRKTPAHSTEGPTRDSRLLMTTSFQRDPVPRRAVGLGASGPPVTKGHSLVATTAGAPSPLPGIGRSTPNRPTEGLT